MHGVTVKIILWFWLYVQSVQFVLLYDTLMMIAEATETSRWIVMYDKIK